MPFSEVQDDVRRVIYASLTSSTDIGGGAQTDGATATFNGNGMFNGGDGYIDWTVAASDYTAAQANDLQESSHVHFELETSFFTETVSSARIITLATSSKFSVDASNNLYNQLDSVNQGLTTHFDQNNQDRSHRNIDIIMTSGIKETYVDGVLIFTAARTIVANIFDTFYLFHGGSGNEIWDAAARVRNLYCITGSQGFNHVRGISNIVLYGDSQFDGQNFPAGWPYTKAGETAGTLASGESMAYRLYGDMQLAGVQTDVVNNASSGDSLADTQTLIDASPDLTDRVVVLNIGINDAADGSLTAGFTANYQTLVTDIVALNPAHLFVCTIVTAGPSTASPSSANRDAIDTANVAIRAAATATSGVTLIDLFDAFDGHNDWDKDNFLAGNLHWSAKGGRLVGETIAAALLNKRGTL